MKTFKHNRADIIGIASSSLCLVHCIATPLLITLGANFMVGPILKPLFLIVALFSISKAAEDTTRTIALLLWIGFFGFLTATIFSNRYEWLEYAEYGFSGLIILGHILNIRHCKHCAVHQHK